MIRREKKQGGFTLVELLVVIAIIGLLSSVVLTTVNSTRTKARDRRRIADMIQIRNALDLYYADNRQYPPRDTASTDGSSGCADADWNSLRTDLLPYIDGLLCDPLGPQTTYMYQYDADSGNNYQTYGMMIVALEHSSNFNVVNTDGGFYQGVDCCSLEFGHQPSYCVSRPGSPNWYTTDVSVCAGGVN